MTTNKEIFIFVAIVIVIIAVGYWYKFIYSATSSVQPTPMNVGTVNQPVHVITPPQIVAQPTVSAPAITNINGKNYYIITDSTKWVNGNTLYSTDGQYQALINGQLVKSSGQPNQVVGIITGNNGLQNTWRVTPANGVTPNAQVSTNLVPYGIPKGTVNFTGTDGKSYYFNPPSPGGVFSGTDWLGFNNNSGYEDLVGNFFTLQAV